MSYCKTHCSTIKFSNNQHLETSTEIRKKRETEFETELMYDENRNFQGNHEGDRIKKNKFYLGLVEMWVAIFQRRTYGGKLQTAAFALSEWREKARGSRHLCAK